MKRKEKFECIRESLDSSNLTKEEKENLKEILEVLGKSELSELSWMQTFNLLGLIKNFFNLSIYNPLSMGPPGDIVISYQPKLLKSGEEKIQEKLESILRGKDTDFIKKCFCKEIKNFLGYISTAPNLRDYIGKTCGLETPLSHFCNFFLGEQLGSHDDDTEHIIKIIDFTNNDENRDKFEESYSSIVQIVEEKYGITEMDSNLLETFGNYYKSFNKLKKRVEEMERLDKVMGKGNTKEYWLKVLNSVYLCQQIYIEDLAQELDKKMGGKFNFSFEQAYSYGKTYGKPKSELDILRRAK